jgi:hypothetical protein
VSTSLLMAFVQAVATACRRHRNTERDKPRWAPCRDYVDGVGAAAGTAVHDQHANRLSYESRAGATSSPPVLMLLGLAACACGGAPDGPGLSSAPTTVSACDAAALSSIPPSCWASAQQSPITTDIPPRQSVWQLQHEATYDSPDPIHRMTVLRDPNADTVHVYIDLGAALPGRRIRVQSRSLDPAQGAARRR